MRKFFLRFILLLSIFTIILVPAEPTFARKKRSSSSSENSAVNDFTFKNLVDQRDQPYQSLSKQEFKSCYFLDIQNAKPIDKL